MDAIKIVAYTTFATAGFTAVYAALLVAEVRRGERITAKRLRNYLDRKTIAIIEKIGKNIEAVNKIYEKGSDEVEKDIIDPVTKPILETQYKYVTLKTGERKIRRTGVSKTSPHLQKLLKRNKKAGKNQSERFKRKLKKLQQEVRREKAKK